jgi:hypothetical protein
MKTLYGLKIYVSTPDGDYSYKDNIVYTRKNRAYNEKLRILKHDYSMDSLITHIHVVEFYLDSGRF